MVRQKTNKTNANNISVMINTGMLPIIYKNPSIFTNDLFSFTATANFFVYSCIHCMCPTVHLLLCDQLCLNPTGCSSYTIASVAHPSLFPFIILCKENKSLVNIDGFLYIIGSIPVFIITLILLATNFIMYAANGVTQTELIFNILRYIVPTFILPIFTGMFVMWLDKRPIKPMLKGLLCYPLFMGSWLLINFKCLFKRDLTWEKINHVRNIKIGEVSQTEQVETEKELI